MIETLGQCCEYGLKLVEGMEKAMFNMGLYPNSGDQGNAKNIIMMEHSLFEIASMPSVVKGVFYMLPIHYQGKLFIRYPKINHIPKSKHTL